MPKIQFSQRNFVAGFFMNLGRTSYLFGMAVVFFVSRLFMPVIPVLAAYFVLGFWLLLSLIVQIRYSISIRKKNDDSI